MGKTIGASAERLQPNTLSPMIQETSSAVYHVIEGAGSTEINGQIITWKKGDTFAVPAWNAYQHHADQGEKVYFYRFDDKVMLKALGLYRFRGQSDESLVQD